MTEKAKQAQREYMRRWRAANKDKVKAAQDRYWERVAESEKSLHNNCNSRGDGHA